MIFWTIYISGAGVLTEIIVTVPALLSIPFTVVK